MKKILIAPAILVGVLFLSAPLETRNDGEPGDGELIILRQDMPFEEKKQYLEEMGSLYAFTLLDLTEVYVQYKKGVDTDGLVVELIRLEQIRIADWLAESPEKVKLLNAFTRAVRITANLRMDIMSRDEQSGRLAQSKREDMENLAAARRHYGRYILE